MKKFIALMICVCCASNVFAGDLEDKVSKLEDELRIIQRKVYRGELEGKAITGSGAVSQVSSNTQVRIGDLEEQVRNVNGRMEELEHKFNSINKKLDLINKDISFRIESIENGKSVAPKNEKETKDKKTEKPAKKEVSKTQSVKEIYDNAYKSLKSEKYEEAEQGFKRILADFAKEKLAGNAAYWLGETYYVREDYERSAVAFANCYENYKTGAKGDGCLLKLGISMKNIKKTEEACIAFKSLKDEFPKANKSLLDRADNEAKKLKCK